MTNAELLRVLKKLVQEERALNVEILRHLREVEERKLYLELGYSSLFKYTVKELGYSEDEAYRRISAMRLICQVPEAEKKIASGRLGLTNAAKIQSFCQKAKGMSAAAKEELVTILENKSTREVERELVQRDPQVLRPERVRLVAEDRVELRMVIDAELKAKLDQLKAFRSHKNPNMSYQELLAELADLGLKKWDPAREKSQRSVSGAEKPPMSATRATLTKQTTNRAAKRTVKQAVGYGANHAAKRGSPPDLQHSPGAKLAAKQAGKHGEIHLPHVRQAAKWATKRSRHIPAAIRREVWRRDGGQCTYMDPITKNKCDSRHLLQIDHIHPYSIGGAHEEQNLRLLCAAHNQWRAEKIFGRRNNSL